MYTLNLNKCTFDLGQAHSDKASYLARWNAPAVVDQLHRDAAGKPLFLLHDGPPYANGDLHLGHFLNKSLKDALLRFKRLEGYFAPFVPGFDCHGLPVELEVEKRGHSKDDPKGFVEACRAYAHGQVAAQTAQFQSFGVAADWEQRYLTMDPEFEVGAAEFMSKLPALRKRLRPVHWCPACASSLAEAEVEHKLKASDSLTVLFPLVGQPNTYLLVWTTTPYTLPANKAVAYHPGSEYVRVSEGDRWLVRLRQPDDALPEPVDLQGLHAVSSYTKAVVPLLPADYVTSAGTGLVHLAPSFGVEDFRVGEAHGLPVEQFVDDTGRFVVPGMEGLTLKQATPHVLAALKDLVYLQETTQHEYPHCWRHKAPVFFKASEEWFLELDEVGQAAGRALDQVQFVPASGKARLQSMLSARTSWCLSRNRLWGTPLVDQADPDDVARLDAMRVEGLSAWHAQGRRRTLDVWADSGMTHELVLQKRFGRKADVYLEGSDQHRGWFQSSLLTAVAVGQEAPYKTVLTHGFVVGPDGTKYSKSSKNYVPLDTLFKTYSPDVLRLWVLQQDFTKELRMSEASLAQANDRYRKLRNTLRFCLQNTMDMSKSQAVRVTHSLHRYMMSELARVTRTVRDAVSRYDFAGAVTALVLFSEQVSGEYFTAVKDTLYCDHPDAPRRREAQTVLLELLGQLVRLLMPVLPFTSEETYALAQDRLEDVAPVAALLTFGPTAQEAGALTEAFSELRGLKQQVNQYVEAHRQEGLKGAERLVLNLAVSENVAALVSAREAEDYFGSASVRFSSHSEDRVVKVELTSYTACPRCRRHTRHAMALTAVCHRCDEVEAALAGTESAQ